MTYLRPGLALDLSSLISGATGGAEDAAIGAVAQVVSADPTFLVNRARAAAAVQMGYNAMATYETWQPFIFLVSTAGALASSYFLVKRRARGGETVTLWTTAALVSLMAAYFTRPSFLRATVVTDPNAPTPSSAALASVLGYLDNQVAYYTATSPGWEGAILTQVATDAGGGTIDPAVQTLLTENSH